MKRRVPRPREIAPLLRLKKPQLNPTKRRLDSALTIDDLRRIAKRRTPKAAFDYTDGAAEEELSLARARQAFRDIEFHPRILRDVTKVDTGATVLGGRVTLPFGVAPTGFTLVGRAYLYGLMAGGEAGVNRAITILSEQVSRTMRLLGVTSLDELAPRHVTQLHRWRPGVS